MNHPGTAAGYLRINQKMKDNTKIGIVAVGLIIASVIFYGAMIAGIVWVIVSVLKAMGVIH